MVDDVAVDAAGEGAGNGRLSLLLAMAMFVLVVDTSLMNVSISKVVHDLGTTVSAVQSAIALEALISAAFILINSKVGDLIGRKRAYVLGLLAYAIGALAMTLAQGIAAIVIFWAIIGGLGASLLLPAMQSLIHGNFEGAAQKKTYALVGAAAAIAAAVGPLLGGFLTTFLSWRVGFLLEVVVIAIILSQIKLVKDVPYTGDRHFDVVGAILSVLGMGGVVLGILVWQEGGDYVVLLIVLGALALAAFARWLVRRHRDGKVTVLDPDLFRLAHFRLGISAQTLQNITLGGAMIALPIFLQIKLEYNAMQTGLSLAPLSLTMFAMAILAGKRAGHRRSASIIRIGFALSTLGMALLIPIVPRASSGWYLVVPLIIAGAGLGLLVSQLNNYSLAPIDEERISEAAGVNSAAGSFGLSFGLAMAGGILLATLSVAFTNMVERQLRDPVVAAAADLEDVGARRRGREQHPTGGACQARASRCPGRDPQDQHRRDESRPPGGVTDPDPGRRAGAVQLLPHDAPSRNQAFRGGRSRRARMTPRGAPRRRLNPVTRELPDRARSAPSIPCSAALRAVWREAVSGQTSKPARPAAIGNELSRGTPFAAQSLLPHCRSVSGWCWIGAVRPAVALGRGRPDCVCRCRQGGPDRLWLYRPSPPEDRRGDSTGSVAVAGKPGARPSSSTESRVMSAVPYGLVVDAF